MKPYATKVIDCQWRQGSRFTKVRPHVAYKCLADLKRKTGRLDPDEMVKAASNKNNPMHKLYNWNDAECGKIYRRQQANTMLTDLRVEYEEMPGIFVQAFTRIQVSIETPERKNKPQAQYYIETREAVVIPDAYQQMCDEIEAFLEHLSIKYRNLKELNKVLTAVKGVIGKRKKKAA